MKEQDKKLVAGGAVALAIGGLLYATTRVNAHPEYSIGKATWDDDMPFEVNTQHSYTFAITNLDTIPHQFRVEAHWFWGIDAIWETQLASGFELNASSTPYMPEEAGTYELIAIVWLDGELSDEVLLSKVQVVA